MNAIAPRSAVSRLEGVFADQSLSRHREVRQDGAVAQPGDQRIPHWLQDEFRTGRLLPGLTSGVLMGISEFVAHLLSQRLAATTRTLEAVLK